jgi:hypothetical protein
MTQPSDLQSLADTLATFRATRSAYQSTSDQALTQLLISLSEELLAQQGQPPAPAAPPVPTADLAALRAELAALQVTCEAQRSELAQLRALVSQPPQPPPAPSLRLAARRRATIVSPPRVMRPIEYWEQHVPDYGDTTTEADLAAARSRPRVRAEDVVLTDADRERLEPRPTSVLPLFWGILVVVVVLGGVILVYQVAAFLIWLF